MQIATNMIKVIDGQNRDNSDKSLIESIKREGVLVPLLVYSDPEGDGYILVAGHRRLASAIEFGLEDVPAVIIPQEQAERARALENLDRKGLHPLDEAMEIRTLQGQGYDNGTIAAMLGMELQKVIRRSKLNNLDPEIQKDFLEGKMDASVAEEYSVMDPEEQKKIRRMTKHTNYGAREIRSFYLDRQGLRLDGVADKLLKAAPSCAECPHNVAAQAPLLFPGSMGSCKDPSCYCKKLKALMKEENVTGVLVEDDKKLVETLKGNKIRTRKLGELWKYSNKGNKGDVKVMIWTGQIKYETPPETKKKDPVRAKRQAEIKKDYGNLNKSLQSEIGLMLAEFADAWYQKNHKGEPLPDKDERVILAKRLLDESYSFKGFITGGSYAEDSSIMKGADNKRIFSMVYLYSAFDGHSMVSPSDVTWYRGEFEVPKVVEIEDLFQLKTSKHRKKVLEICNQMEALCKEYKKLEDEK